MLATHTGGGGIAMRPMSNNGEVDYDGDPYYFAWAAARMVADIEHSLRSCRCESGQQAADALDHGVGSGIGIG